MLALLFPVFCKCAKYICYDPNQMGCNFIYIYQTITKISQWPNYSEDTMVFHIAGVPDSPFDGSSSTILTNLNIKSYDENFLLEINGLGSISSLSFESSNVKLWTNSLSINQLKIYDSKIMTNSGKLITNDGIVNADIFSYQHCFDREFSCNEMTLEINTSLVSEDIYLEKSYPIIVRIKSDEYIKLYSSIHTYYVITEAGYNITIQDPPNFKYCLEINMLNGILEPNYISLDNNFRDSSNDNIKQSTLIAKYPMATSNFYYDKINITLNGEDMREAIFFSSANITITSNVKVLPIGELPGNIINHGDLVVPINITSSSDVEVFLDGNSEFELDIHSLISTRTGTINVVGNSNYTFRNFIHKRSILNIPRLTMHNYSYLGVIGEDNSIYINVSSPVYLPDGNRPVVHFLTNENRKYQDFDDFTMMILSSKDECEKWDVDFMGNLNHGYYRNAYFDSKCIENNLTVTFTEVEQKVDNYICIGTSDSCDYYDHMFTIISKTSNLNDYIHPYSDNLVINIADRGNFNLNLTGRNGISLKIYGRGTLEIAGANSKTFKNFSAMTSFNFIDLLEPIKIPYFVCNSEIDYKQFDFSESDVYLSSLYEWVSEVKMRSLIVNLTAKYYSETCVVEIGHDNVHAYGVDKTFDFLLPIHDRNTTLFFTNTNKFRFLVVDDDPGNLTIFNYIYYAEFVSNWPGNYTGLKFADYVNHISVQNSNVSIPMYTSEFQEMYIIRSGNNMLNDISIENADIIFTEFGTANVTNLKLKDSTRIFTYDQHEVTIENLYLNGNIEGQNATVNNLFVEEGSTGEIKQVTKQINYDLTFNQPSLISVARNNFNPVHVNISLSNRRHFLAPEYSYLFAEHPIDIICYNEGNLNCWGWTSEIHGEGSDKFKGSCLGACFSVVPEWFKPPAPPTPSPNPSSSPSCTVSSSPSASKTASISPLPTQTKSPSVSISASQIASASKSISASLSPSLSSTPQPLPTATRTNDSSSKDGALKPGATAGIAIGSVVALTILIILIVYYIKKKKSCQKNYLLSETLISDPI